MKYKELKVNLPKERSEALYELLEELQVAGYYEILFDGERKKEAESEILADNTNIRIYLNLDEIEKEIKILIFLKLESPGDVFWESREIETRDYEEAYKEFYKAFPIGKKLWVVPVWEKESFLQESKPDTLPLFINPGVAFGTGHHETTKLILETLDQWFENGETFSKVCDLGTGSGILSVGLARLGAKEILALDIDPNAVRAAWDNWVSNGFPSGQRFTVTEAGLEYPPLWESSFDLAIANITFGVLSQNIQHLKRINTPRFVFSGIITEKRDPFLQLLSQHIPGHLHFEKEWNEWWVLDWKRN